MYDDAIVARILTIGLFRSAAAGVPSADGCTGDVMAKWVCFFRVFVLCLSMICAMPFIGCQVDDDDHPCQAENHCIRQDGEVNCEEGYTWEDPSDAENFTCVEVIGDGEGDGDGDTVLHDFAAAAPWYGCPTSLEEGVTEVVAFDRADQYFGSENLRQIDAEVDFPEEGNWGQVGMWFHLECPESDLCDHWDRAGSIQLVLNPDDPPEEWEHLELLRHMTPYRISMCQYIDITPVAGLLKGRQTLTSWIDTWVGPGHSNGDGWRLTAKFVFYPGAAAPADEVINIWGRRNITVGEIETDSNVDAQIESFTVTIPEAASQVVAHLMATGHSFGNTSNCAEFCEMRHDIIVDGTIADSINPWRADCAQNPVSPQYGTWEYPRNGWCPGAVSVGDQVDITNLITPGQTSLLDLDILLSNGQEYDNVSPVDLLPYTILSLKLYIYE